GDDASGVEPFLAADFAERAPAAAAVVNAVTGENPRGKRLLSGELAYQCVVGDGHRLSPCLCLCFCPVVGRGGASICSSAEKIRSGWLSRVAWRCRPGEPASA